MTGNETVLNPWVFDVVVVGSINVDMVTVVDHLPAAGETVAGGTFRQFGGGKGANQSVASARMGARTALISAVGRDPMADIALEDLREAGVDVGHLQWRDDKPTGVALVVVSVSGVRIRSPWHPGRTRPWTRIGCWRRSTG